MSRRAVLALLCVSLLLLALFFHVARARRERFALYGTAMMNVLSRNATAPLDAVNKTLVPELDRLLDDVNSAAKRKEVKLANIDAQRYPNESESSLLNIARDYKCANYLICHMSQFVPDKHETLMKALGAGSPVLEDADDDDDDGDRDSGGEGAS